MSKFQLIAGINKIFNRKLFTGAQNTSYEKITRIPCTFFLCRGKTHRRVTQNRYSSLVDVFLNLILVFKQYFSKPLLFLFVVSKVVKNETTIQFLKFRIKVHSFHPDYALLIAFNDSHFWRWTKLRWANFFLVLDLKLHVGFDIRNCFGPKLWCCIWLEIAFFLTDKNLFWFVSFPFVQLLWRWLIIYLEIWHYLVCL